MYYAHYDSKSREFLNFYDDTTHTNIPKPSFKVSEDELNEAFKIGANYVTDDLKLIYVEKQISLEEQKANKIFLLEQLKTQALNADILYKAKYYQADEKSKELLLQSLTVYNLRGITPDYFCWKSSDNTTNQFNLEDLKSLTFLIAERTQKITYLYWQKKELIKKASSKEELENINIGFDL